MRPRASREEIEHLLSRKERERLSYATLADESGISAATLASWASRLRREVRETDVPAFIEVVADDDDPLDHDIPIEILVGDVLVRVRTGFCAETLARVLETVRSSC